MTKNAADLPALGTVIRERTALVCETGEAFCTGDARTDPQISRGVKGTLGMQSMLEVPLQVDSTIRRVLVAESAHPDHFSPEEQRFFVAAIHRVGMCIGRRSQTL